MDKQLDGSSISKKSSIDQNQVNLQIQLGLEVWYPPLTEGILEMNISQPKKDEAQHAIKALKNGKACSIDNIMQRC